MIFKRMPPMLIIGLLFFVFGFISWLNAILIPYFKLSLQLSLEQAMMVTFAFYVSYFVMAIPSSHIIERTGFKRGMILGLFVMAAGALLFVPGAVMASYPLFLAGLFVQATGLTLLQTAANPYVTVLGPLESAARRMSVMGVCNKTAGALAPILLLKSITRGPSEIDDITRSLPGLRPDQAKDVLRSLLLRLRTPYELIALALVVLGLVIHFSGLPDLRGARRVRLAWRRTLDLPHLMLGVLAIFCSVSVEVLAVDSIINYAQYQGYHFQEAKYFASYTLVVMIISYGIGIMLIPRYITQRQALTSCASLGILLTLGVLFTPMASSVWGVVFLGLCNALIWPSIWPLALEGLGGFTEKGSALLIMGIIGGAVTPLIFGSLAGSWGVRIAYTTLLPLYGFLLYYGYKGSRVRPTRSGA